MREKMAAAMCAKFRYGSMQECLILADAALDALAMPDTMMAAHWASWVNGFEKNDRRAIDLIKELWTVWPKLIEAIKDGK